MALIKHLLFFFYIIINKISKLKIAQFSDCCSQRRSGCEQPGPSKNLANTDTCTIANNWKIYKITKYPLRLILYPFIENTSHIKYIQLK